MGRKSKATKSCIKNLLNSRNRPSETTTSSAALDHSDSDTEYSPETDIGSFLMQMEDNREIPEWEESDDEEEEIEIDEEAETGIQDDATFLAFVLKLQGVQSLLHKEETERNALIKRPKRCLKNSSRTQWNHAQKWHKMATDNLKFKFITDFFKKPSIPGDRGAGDY